MLVTKREVVDIMSKTYLISYDLKESDTKDYDVLFEYIKSYGTWAHITESLWAVQTDKSAVAIRDELKEKVKKDSALFVIKSGGEAAWRSVLCRNTWLQENL